jgi:hypothetical protein
MVDLNKVDAIEKGMILDVFISIGHATEPSGDIDDEDFGDQIS